MLHAIWNYLFGWAGIDVLVGAAACVIAALEPPFIAVLIPDLRKWAIAVAVVAFTFMGIEAHGYKLGLDEKQRQWDAAIAREAVNGEKARADAERDIGPVTSDRSMFSSDPDNRDGDGKQPGDGKAGPLRWLAPHHLFGKR
jgi:hypothetical protein